MATNVKVASSGYIHKHPLIQPQNKHATVQPNNDKKPIETQVSQMLNHLLTKVENQEEIISDQEKVIADQAKEIAMLKALLAEKEKQAIPQENQVSNKRKFKLKTVLKSIRTQKYMRKEVNSLKTQVGILDQKVVEAQQLATTDHLTGLDNKRNFDENHKSVMDKAIRPYFFIIKSMFLNGKSLSEIKSFISEAKDSPVSLIMADLDRFKLVNDTYGHSSGDSVLSQFAKIMKDSVRGTDLVARYGGEEFAVICPKTAITQAVAVAERIRKSTQDYSFVLEDHSQLINKTSSFGVASYSPKQAIQAFLNDSELISMIPKDPKEAEAFFEKLIKSATEKATENTFKRADAELYQAKALGRNKVSHDSCASKTLENSRCISEETPAKEPRNDNKKKIPKRTEMLKENSKIK